jgi:phage FluMu gp28-like protein
MRSKISLKNSKRLKSNRYTGLKKRVKKAREKKAETIPLDQVEVPDDAVEFAEKLFNFTPKEYQANLLEEKSKRIVVRWSRQAGKTTCIALRALWYALTHDNTLTLIVAPSLRQSMIMSDRIGDFIGALAQDYKGLVTKLQRTTVRFWNGSRIVALPNSPQLLRGYTAHQVICDEAAFFEDDQLVFYSVLYPMLSTTDGILIASSTPWSKDSVFYQMCQSSEFKKHVCTCDDVVKSGLVKQSFMDEMRAQLPAERFQREFMSEFVEDVDAWLTQSLIVSCIESNLQPYDFMDVPKGEFYVGVDFGKEMDFSVVLVLQKTENTLRTVHVHRFPLKTEYASIIGYVKSLLDRWRQIRAVYADVTGVGNYIVEDMFRSGINKVTGVTFTVQSKEEMATIMREKMRNGEVKLFYIPATKREDVDLTAELNVEKYELMKTGHLRFSHPEGGHDDVFWSMALVVYASVKAPLPGAGAVMLPH